MRFLVDMQLSPALAEWLRTLGHDAMHVSERQLGREPDDVLLSLACAEDRIVISADLDFPRLLSERNENVPGLILLRHGNYSEQEARECVRRVLMALAPDELKESVAVVDQRRIRRRQLPLR